VPTDDGIRIDQNEAVGPLMPRAAKEHPEETIGRPKLGPDALLLEDGQLLAQDEIFDDYIQPRPEKEADHSDDQTAQEPNHAPASPP
jgi:hypothetical protein